MASLNIHVPLGLNSGIQLTYAICLFSLFFVVFFKGGGGYFYHYIHAERKMLQTFVSIHPSTIDS